jgi:hypothetical protein
MHRFYHINLLILAALLGGCATTHTEAEFKRPDYSECVAGDCRNGLGTNHYPDGTEITGQWLDGLQVAGKYDIRWPCQPDRTYPLTIDTSRYYVVGTVIRSCNMDASRLSMPRRITSYTGTFKTITNPFTREQLSSYKTGKYTDENGIMWEGEFDYIPIQDSVELVGYGNTFLRSGAFVFIGAKVDPVLDEVVRGLFITEPTRPGESLRLLRARPDYLGTLRSTFVADSNQYASDRVAEDRASREMFSNIATLITGAASAYGTYKLAKMSDRANMDSLTNVIMGQKSPVAANEELRRVSPNGSATPARPLTVTEYRNQQSAGETGLSSTLTTSLGNVLIEEEQSQQLQANLLTTPNKKKSYPGLPKIIDREASDYQLNENTYPTWCKRHTQELRDSYKNSENELLSIGSCTCNDVSVTKMLRPDYACKFPYTFRQNVPDNSK